MADRFGPGSRVRTRRVDPPHHTRLPRYARAAVGTVLEVEGRHPLADDRARGLPAELQPVYTVSFDAAQLFGAGDHVVMLALFESYLEESDA